MSMKKVFLKNGESRMKPMTKAELAHQKKRHERPEPPIKQALRMLADRLGVGADMDLIIGPKREE